MNAEEIRLLTNAGYLIIVLFGMQGGFALAREGLGLFREFLKDWRKVHNLAKDEKNEQEKPK